MVILIKRQLSYSTCDRPLNDIISYFFLVHFRCKRRRQAKEQTSSPAYTEYKVNKNSPPEEYAELNKNEIYSLPSNPQPRNTNSLTEEESGFIYRHYQISPYEFNPDEI